MPQPKRRIGKQDPFGHDPYADSLGSGAVAGAVQAVSAEPKPIVSLAPKRAAEKAAVAPTGRQKPSRAALHVRIQVTTLDRAGRAIEALSGPPHRFNRQNFVEEALEQFVGLLEKQYNDGNPY